MTKIFFAAVIASFLSSSVFADTLKADTDLKPLAEIVMTKVAKGNLSAAFDAMKPYVVISEAEFQSAALNSKAQRDQFGIRYGKTVGYEFIGQKKIGESLIRLTYMEKTEKHALPWMFYFYRTPSGWMLNSFSWNDQIPQLFALER